MNGYMVFVYVVFFDEKFGFIDEVFDLRFVDLFVVCFFEYVVVVGEVVWIDGYC